MQILECLFIAYNTAELLGLASGHQASPIFTIILSLLNISKTLQVQPISMLKVASACKLEGLHTDVFHVYRTFNSVKKQTLEFSHILYS